MGKYWENDPSKNNISSDFKVELWVGGRNRVQRAWWEDAHLAFNPRGKKMVAWSSDSQPVGVDHQKTLSLWSQEPRTLLSSKITVMKKQQN